MLHGFQYLKPRLNGLCSKPGTRYCLRPLYYKEIGCTFTIYNLIIVFLKYWTPN